MLKNSSEFNLRPVNTRPILNLGSMIMIGELNKFNVFISSFCVLYSECPSMSAFVRKIANEKHASGKPVHLIIFPEVWSLCLTYVNSSSPLFFLDHAFIIRLCHGQMIKSIPWSFVRCVYSISVIISSDAWSRHPPRRKLIRVYLFTVSKYWFYIIRNLAGDYNRSG